VSLVKNCNTLDVFYFVSEFVDAEGLVKWLFKILESLVMTR